MALKERRAGPRRSAARAAARIAAGVVGPLEGDGTLPPERHPFAGALLAALEERMPELRAQAWIGQVEARHGGPLDIGDEDTRRAIVAAAAELLDLGFRGISCEHRALVLW